MFMTFATHLTHEIGHAIGMRGHSPIPADLMYEVGSRSFIPGLDEIVAHHVVRTGRPVGVHFGRRAQVFRRRAALNA